MKSSVTYEPEDGGASEGEARASYSAPALEKGLDILETLAGTAEPMTAGALARRLGRSKSEIFRMVHVLVVRGYLERDPATDQLTLSNRLFDLGIRTPRPRDLMDAALPAMRAFAAEVGQSPHLVVVNGGETVVIASASGGAEASFALRLGYRRAAHLAASGLTILAFQPEPQRWRLLAEAVARSGLDPEPSLEQTLAAIAAEGSYLTESHHFRGVVDICAPVLDRAGHSVASVVVPCFQKVGGGEGFEAIRARLVETCAGIGAALL